MRGHHRKATSPKHVTSSGVEKCPCGRRLPQAESLSKVTKYNKISFLPPLPTTLLKFLATLRRSLPVCNRKQTINGKMANPIYPLAKLPTSHIWLNFNIPPRV